MSFLKQMITFAVNVERYFMLYTPQAEYFDESNPASFIMDGEELPKYVPYWFSQILENSVERLELEQSTTIFA